MEFKIETFSPSDQRIEEAESFRDAILKYDNHPLIENYSHENLDFSKQLGISLGKAGDEYVYFSTIFRNEKIYGNNTARLINRFYVKQEYRAIFKRNTFKFAFGKDGLNESDNCLLFNNTDSLVGQQIQFIKAYYPEIDFVFFSREYPSARFLKNYAELIFEKTGIKWKFDDGLFLVCDAPNKKACWQYMLYHEVTGKGNFQILNNKINVEQYKLLKD